MYCENFFEKKLKKDDLKILKEQEKKFAESLKNKNEKELDRLQKKLEIENKKSFVDLNFIFKKIAKNNNFLKIIFAEYEKRADDANKEIQ